MNLSTLSCAHAGCTKTFALVLPTSMWEVIYEAKEVGWLIEEPSGEIAWCPDHNPVASPSEIYAVGCYTCDWEDEDDDDPITSEDQAKRVAMEHQCEPDTWIKSPRQLASQRARREEYQERRSVERAAEQLQAEEAAKAALELQLEIESWASNWLRIRNFLLPWRKRHLRRRA